MTLTMLDPNTALVVLDLQEGHASLPFIHTFDGVLERNLVLLRAFRTRGLPVVLVTVVGGWPGRTDRRRPARNGLPDSPNCSRY